MTKNTIAILVVVVLAAIALIFFSRASKPATTDRTTREVALACTTDMATEYHIHPRLTILANGERVPIPADIGIQPTCMTSLHTHTPDGLIHVESPEKRDFTLGDFFAVWGEPFSRDEVLDYRTDETNRIRVTVNGAVVDTYEETVLRDGDEIVIEYGS